jgi:antitoxin component YwqK of YwqJK toxin-antitoxin module
MDAKEAFYYTIKANNYSLGYIAYSNWGVDRNWVDLYASTFDNSNYQNARNDEFQKKAYSVKINNEINNGVNSCNFNKTFSIESWTTFGEFDFNKGYFPLDNEKLLRNIPDLFRINDIGFQISIGQITNYSEFDFILKMTVDDASKFINTRKDNNGKIDRNINVRIVYNVVNNKLKPTSMGEEKLTVFVHKIILNSNLNKSLGELTPIVKLNNRSDTIYFNSSWRELNKFELSNSKYYRIINYKNGEIDGAIKDYFISGAIQMVGYYTNEGTVQNGLFTYYYENGKMRSSVNFINGVKDGCEYEWREDGRCIDSSVAPGRNARCYENGKMDTYSKKCPCEGKDQ